MTTTENSMSLETTRTEAKPHPPGGIKFDWTATILCTLLIGGVYLDGWAHAHGKVDSTFFTPWHAVLYSGFAIVGAFLILNLVRNRIKGYPWLDALPPGYNVSLLGVIIFYSVQEHPAVNTLFSQERGIASILLQTVILMGLVLLLVRRWLLPFGSLTLIFTLSSVLISFLGDEYTFILAALVAGLFADLLLWRLKPSVTRLLEFRLFAFVVPLVYYGMYFLVLVLTKGVDWTIHLWMGSIVIAGIIGLLLSYLLIPPLTETNAGVTSEG